MIKNFRKIAGYLFIFLSAILFFSCTFIHEKKNGKITFSTSKLLQNSTRSISNISNSDFIEVSILGDYTETKTINIKEDSPVIFEEIPVDSKVYAEVYIYRLTPLKKRLDTYYGKSKEIIVQEGDNLLTVLIKPLKEQIEEPKEKVAYTVKHLQQNINDDDYTEVTADRETNYGNSLEREIAKILVNATVFRFDASDLMPAEVGAGTFWTGMVNYVSGAEDSATCLKNIDESWPN